MASLQRPRRAALPVLLLLVHHLADLSSAFTLPVSDAPKRSRSVRLSAAGVAGAAVEAAPFTFGLRFSSNPFSLSSDLGPLISDLVDQRPASMTGPELRTSPVARMLDSLVLLSPPPMFKEGGNVPRRLQPLHVPLLEADDGSFVVAAHVLPFARDRLGPLGAGEETVVLSRVVMGSAEVSYYREGASVEGRNDCVCFGGQCPRSSCEWRENGRDGWVKFVSQVRGPGDGVEVLHPYERSAVTTMDAQEPTVLLEVIMRRPRAAQATSSSSSGGGNRGRMAEAATTLLQYRHHPPYERPLSSSSVYDDDEKAGPGGREGEGSRIMTGSEEELHAVGVGGLDGPFEQIFRRVFASRLAPKELVKEMGIRHVRGLLLHGPPGCGKTLLARQMSKMLKCREPVKIVNGPEVFGSLVGKSEENVRALFKEAEDEQRKMGDDSMLHVIILDEMDSICSRRGSHGTNDWRDTVVNQLLSKIDGVEALNNILLIGMTNRKDLIDEALLRPGRLEVHVEVGLPDETGRQQILDIHTSTMRKYRRLDPLAQHRLPEVARRTKNYSGADLEGLVKTSVSYAFERVLRGGGRQEEVTVTWEDLERSLEETRPLFGADAAGLPAVPPYMVDLSPSYSQAKEDLLLLLGALASPSDPATSWEDEAPGCLFALVEGPSGSGRTTLLSHLAFSSAAAYPFIRRLGPESLLGRGVDARASLLREAVLDSRQSNGPALVVLDGLDLLLDDACLPMLFTLLSQPPSPCQPLAVLASWSRPDLAESVAASAVASRFHVVLGDVLRPLAGEEEVQRVVEARLPRLRGKREELHRACEMMGLSTGGATLREVHRSIDIYRLRKKGDAASGSP